MTTRQRELLAFTQRLLQPPPERPNHEHEHDEACRWADNGHDGEG